MHPWRARKTISRHGGFTLIEVVVALAILALASAVIYESLGWSLRHTQVLRQRESAWLFAESALAQVRARNTAGAELEQGETADGLRWTVRVDPRKSLVAASSPIQPFDVVIMVRWGSRQGQQVTLQSIEALRTES